MMGKTHLTMGIAASLLIAQPQTAGECIAALIGGSVGGVLADIDILDNDTHDSIKMQLTTLGISFMLLLIDNLFHLGICDSIFNSGYRLPMIGCCAFAVLWILGVFTGHRTFTHSFLAGALYTVCVWAIHPSLMLPFAAGYLSHLALDLLNRKNLPLFYPCKRGFCLKLCYADSFANKIFFRLGIVISCTYLLYITVQYILTLL